MAQLRRLGDSEVAPVGLGCMNVTHAYGPPMDEDDARALLRRALDLGYTHFDTATIYGAGRSEELIGETLSERRNEFFLASKCVLSFRDGARVLDARPEAIKAACEASLKRLRTDVIDLYYLHRPDPNVPLEDSVGALSELVAEGKIRNIGLSEMSSDMLRRAHAVHPVAAMQSEYSLWVRNPEIALMDTCRELGTALVAFSPVGRGFLADPPVEPENMKPGDMRAGGFFPRFIGDNYAANLPLLEEARACAGQVGCTVAQLALAWTMAKGEHVLPIPGTTSLSHLEDNLAAGGIPLTPDMVARLDAAFDPRKPVGPRYSKGGQSSVTTETFDFETLE